MTGSPTEDVGYRREADAASYGPVGTAPPQRAVVLSGASEERANPGGALHEGT